ncbi:hypothetical protein Pcinc_006605 [Petrolisthes cinctipes]|uniref:Stathmin n=1 Tax=Petrolisthes cinctipes TaxID=88211 RepID=A0AAE1GB80_PETCI|nr:hypothetical protein Pcinc_006605 [Petrolisthes cinctipes]
MRYEVILAEPSADKPDPTTPVSPKSMTAEEIAQKLQQAEERRKSMEASRLATVGECKSRLEEASRKKEETNAAFISATQAALEDKLDATSSNREVYPYGLHAKITDYLNNVDNVRKQLDAQINDLRQTIEDKLCSAEENRTENMGKMLKRLKEHVDLDSYTKCVTRRGTQLEALMTLLPGQDLQPHLYPDFDRKPGLCCSNSNLNQSWGHNPADSRMVS